MTGHQRSAPTTQGHASNPSIDSIRLMELVGSLSLVIDLGLGQPLEHALRSAVIAVRIGELLGLSTEDSSDAFYIALLRFVGCTAAAHEMAEVMGDEIAARAWLTPVFTGRLAEMPEAVRPAAHLRCVGQDAPAMAAVGKIRDLLRDGDQTQIVLASSPRHDCQECAIL